MSRIRLHLETLDDRILPSELGPAGFLGLNVAVNNFSLSDPPMRLAPPIALTRTAVGSLPALTGLENAVQQITPTDPCLQFSPVFFARWGSD